MARIPSEVIDQIRSAVDIADVIGQDVQLKKQGKNLMGHCPFHQDDTPSFSVNQEKQFFYCFSCHRSGNVFSFLEQLHELSFPQAVAAVAKFANLDLPAQYQEGGTGAPANRAHDQFYRVHTQAAKLYHHILVNTPAGQAALAYLTKRGTTRELIDRFQLGFAPDLDDQQVLLEYCQKQGLDYQFLRQTGLFIDRASGELADRFRGRVIYPLRDERGQVIGFSGRILSKTPPPNTPKYLNSPETPLFNKRRTLFNLDLAKQAAREAGHLTLFEGFMDVISAYGAGVKTGIASMGTSFTSEQVQVIRRLTKQLTIAYDGDEPGQAAIERSLALLEEAAPDLAVKVVQLPAGIDPDEYVQKYGAIKFRDYLAHGEESPVDFRLAYLKKGKNLEKQSDLIAYLNAALQVVAKVTTPVGRNVYLNQLATEFQLDEASLQRQLATLAPAPPQVEQAGAAPPAAPGPPPPVAADRPPQVVDRAERAAQLLLKYYCYDEDVRYQLDASPDFRFPQPGYQQLFEVIKDYLAGHERFAPAAVMDQLDAAGQQRLTQVERQLINEEEKDRVVADCRRVLGEGYSLTEAIEEKQAAIQEASMIGDADRLVQLTSELVNLYQRQQAMKTEEINQ